MRDTGEFERENHTPYSVRHLIFLFLSFFFFFRKRGRPDHAHRCSRGRQRELGGTRSQKDGIPVVGRGNGW